MPATTPAVSLHSPHEDRQRRGPALLDALPDDVSTDTILYRLHVRAKVARGLAQIDRGEVIPHDQVMEDLDRWLFKVDVERGLEQSERGEFVSQEEAKTRLSRR